ncbi:MAG: hypothetical protein IJS12_07095 [Lachnospiraceae bacterium]|nr:hypothetical protein [Lachnospiraceae bacterium]
MAEHRKNRKKRNKRRHYALLISLVISTLFITVWSYFQLPRAYASYVYDPVETPVLALAMQGIHDGVYPWSGSYASETADTGVPAATGEAEMIVNAEDDTITDTTIDIPETEDDQKTDIVNPEAETAAYEDDETTSGTESETSEDPVAEETTVIETGTNDDSRLIFHGPVDDDYFNDALFIGDSRMVGLSEYCEPLDTRADFYVKKALTIYNLLDGKAIRSFDGTQKSLWEVLDEKQYGKIYIMVGINEIGVGNAEYFRDAYEQVVDKIREAQPDAFIFINSIMHVSQSKSDADSLYNNPNINARNNAIASLADNRHIFYLNINEAVDDENGALRSDITFDDIHLKGSCYEPWHEYLLAHGVK